ncbi:hypothetical protein PG993_006856 [Apiospora rasikravindrae]|uniref:DUF6604 domain-containing protein n=1 Tax=Apiospora rasikravindrae TaxID=990691 RepID=A0ABR1SVU7_9PEZI
MASIRNDHRQYSHQTGSVLKWLVVTSQSLSLAVDPVHQVRPSNDQGQRARKKRSYTYTGEQYKRMSAFIADKHEKQVIVPPHIIRDLKSAIALRIKTTRRYQESTEPDPESDNNDKSYEEDGPADAMPEESEDAIALASNEYKMKKEVEESEARRRLIESQYEAKVLLPLDEAVEYLITWTDEDQTAGGESLSDTLGSTQPPGSRLLAVPQPANCTVMGVVIQVLSTIADELQYDFDSRYGGIIFDQLGVEQDIDFSRPDLYQILLFLGHDSALSRKMIGASTFESRVRFLQSIKDRVGSHNPGDKEWPQYLPQQAMGVQERRPGDPAEELDDDLVESYRAHYDLGSLLLDFVHLERCRDVLTGYDYGSSIISPLHSEASKIWSGPRTITIGAWLATAILLRTQPSLKAHLPRFESDARKLRASVRKNMQGCLVLKSSAANGQITLFAPMGAAGPGLAHPAGSPPQTGRCSHRPSA